MKRVALIGAWGYGNVGDDAYLMVWRHYFPDVEFSIHNSDAPRTCPDADLYLFGGGGIVFDNGTAHFEYMNTYVQEARRRGIPYAFLSVGVQIRVNIGNVAEAACFEEALHRWTPVLKGAEFITVRDTRSCLELQRRGVSASQHPDLCYLIPGMRESYAHFVTVIPGPGVSMAFRDFRQVLEHRLQEGGGLVLLNTGASHDDCLLDDLAAEYPVLFSIRSGYATPALARDVIRSSRVVLTGRYHGLVFARAAGKDYWIPPVARPLKIAVEDLAADPAEAIRHIERLSDYLGIAPVYGIPENLVAQSETHG